MTTMPFVEEVTERCGDSVLASTIRAATEEDLLAAANLFANGKCPHSIVVDTAGWPYDFRTCHTCGKSLGLI